MNPHAQFGFRLKMIEKDCVEKFNKHSRFELWTQVTRSKRISTSSWGGVIFVTIN
jgi:hypothetical protein